MNVHAHTHTYPLHPRPPPPTHTHTHIHGLGPKLLCTLSHSLIHCNGLHQGLGVLLSVICCTCDWHRGAQHCPLDAHTLYTQAVIITAISYGYYHDHERYVHVHNYPGHDQGVQSLFKGHLT